MNLYAIILKSPELFIACMLFFAHLMININLPLEGTSKKHHLQKLLKLYTQYMGMN